MCKNSRYAIFYYIVILSLLITYIAQVVGTSGRFSFNGVTLRSEVSRNFMKTTAGYEQQHVESKEMIVIENNSDRKKYAELEYVPPAKKNGFDPYLMSNNSANIMFCQSADGVQNCFYSTVMDMNGNQYLIPMAAPRMNTSPMMPMNAPMMPWQNEINMNMGQYSYQAPMMQMSAPPMPSQIDYKSISSINPAMMFSNFNDFDQQTV